MSVDDVQSLLQRMESLTLEVVDNSSSIFLLPSYISNSCGLCIKFACEGFIAILHSDGVMTFRVGRDVDVEAHDVACVDGFLVDHFARIISNAYQISIVERVEIDS